eukprot:1145532-Pelagomonas_calceolata.AAC.2
MLFCAFLLLFLSWAPHLQLSRAAIPLTSYSRGNLDDVVSKYMGSKGEISGLQQGQKQQPGQDAPAHAFHAQKRISIRASSSSSSSSTWRRRGVGNQTSTEGEARRASQAGKQVYLSHNSVSNDLSDHELCVHPCKLRSHPFWDCRKQQLRVVGGSPFLEPYLQWDTEGRGWAREGDWVPGGLRFRVYRQVAHKEKEASVLLHVRVSMVVRVINNSVCSATWARSPCCMDAGEMMATVIICTLPT